jgi:uncharacterized membrane protein YhaH (DUF805 family)
LNDLQLRPVFNGVSIAFGAIIFVPLLAVSIRRLHDTGRSGWMFLINLIPVIGTIIFLFFLMEDSSPSYNRFGEYPKFNLL